MVEASDVEPLDVLHAVIKDEEYCGPLKYIESFCEKLNKNSKFFMLILRIQIFFLFPNRPAY